MKKTTWILGWRSNSRHELSFSWRFCGPRLLFGGDISSATCIESSISRQDDAHKREPRKSTNYTGTVNTSSSLTLHLLSSFLLDLQLRKSSLLNYCISRCSVTTNLPLFCDSFTFFPYKYVAASHWIHQRVNSFRPSIDPMCPPISLSSSITELMSYSVLLIYGLIVWDFFPGLRVLRRMPTEVWKCCSVESVYRSV